MKISACVITKNEEAEIVCYLLKLKPYVQELIMVDTGSTDGTVATAKQAGAEVYPYLWQGDFAAAKNFALSKASGDWIVFLDADEFFSSETAENLTKLIAVYGTSYDAFLTKMVNIDAANENKVLDEFYTVRVFRRSPNMIYQGKIHEQLGCADGREMRIKTIGENELLVYHTGYSTDKIKAKAERNLKMIWNEVKRVGQIEKYYVYLAEAYAGIDDEENAVRYATLDVQSGRKGITYASRSYRILIQGLKNLKAPTEKLRAAIEKAMADFPDIPDFYAEYGLFFYERKAYVQAYEYFTKALRMQVHYDQDDKTEPSLLKNFLPVLHKLTTDAKQKGGVYIMKDINDIEEKEKTANRMDISDVYHKKATIIAVKIQWFTITLLLAGTEDKTDWKDLIPRSLCCLVDRYWARLDKLDETSLDGFCSMLNAILGIHDDVFLEKYLRMGLDFSWEGQLRIVEILAKGKRFFEMSIYLFSMPECYFNNSQLCYWAGISYYQNKQFDRAEAHFLKAKAMGSEENDIASYLVWIQERR